MMMKIRMPTWSMHFFPGPRNYRNFLTPRKLTRKLRVVPEL
jgi:hypothetical protein